MTETCQIFERGLLRAQKWTSCGERNILRWIRDVFVYKSRREEGEFKEDRRRKELTEDLLELGYRLGVCWWHVKELA